MFTRVAIFATFILLLSACAPAPSQATAPPTDTAYVPEDFDENASVENTGDTTCEFEGPIVLGAVESLSGPIAPYGRMIRMGIELAVAELNDKEYFGPDASLEVTFKDDEGNKEVAKKAFKELVQQDEIVAIIGPTLSSSAFEAGPIAQEAGVPMLGTSLTADGITTIGNYIFRNSLPEADVIPTTLNTAREALHLRRAGLLYMEGDDFTESGFQTMKKAAEKQGMRVVAEESFKKGALDFTEQIQRFKERDVDTILVSALVTEAAAILIQIRQNDMDATVIGGNGFNSPELVSIAGPAAEGAIFGTAWLNGQGSQQALEFASAFQSKYGVEPDQFAAQSYTGIILYAQAIRNACSRQRADIRSELAKLRLVPTPLGTFSFTSDRNPLHPPQVVMVRNGNFIPFTAGLDQ